MGNKAEMYIDIMALHPEVTGSCFLCILKLPDKRTVRFLVDCGLFREEEYEKFNHDFPFNPENIEFTLITHNHVDHCGRLPLLYKKGYLGKVYCSKQTKIFLPLALEDTQKVLKDVSKRQHTRSLYEEKDVYTSLNNTIDLDFNEKFSINENISVTLLENGHLIGASMFLLEITYPEKEPINLLFTGDYNCKNAFIHLKGSFEERITELKLTAITEATYGSTDSDEIIYLFEEKVAKAVKEEKTVIIPVFSLGRAQEVLLKLKESQEEGIISQNIPIYFDGKLAQNYTGLYLKSKDLIEEEKKKFLPMNIVYVNSDSRNSLLNCDNVKIIVTTSGMGTYGPARTYIPFFISKKNVLILFTGYTAEGTFGAKLKDTEEGKLIELGGLVSKKYAEVSYCTEFSGHAKADELINLLKNFKNLRAVLINHGSKNSKEGFAEKVLEEIETKTVGILNRDYFFRVDCWGVNKTLSTKFK